MTDKELFKLHLKDEVYDEFLEIEKQLYKLAASSPNVVEEPATWYLLRLINFWTNPFLPKDLSGDSPEHIKRYYEYLSGQRHYYGEVLLSSIAVGLIISYIYGKQLLRAFSSFYEDEDLSTYPSPQILKKKNINIYLDRERYKSLKTKGLDLPSIKELSKDKELFKLSEDPSTANQQQIDKLFNRGLSGFLQSIFSPAGEMFSSISSAISSILPGFIKSNPGINIFVYLGLGYVGLKLGMFLGNELFFTKKEEMSMATDQKSVIYEIRKKYHEFRNLSAQRAFLKNLLLSGKTINPEVLEKIDSKNIDKLILDVKKKRGKSIKKDIEESVFSLDQDLQKLEKISEFVDTKVIEHLLRISDFYIQIYRTK